MRGLLPLVALFLALLIIHPDPGGGVAPPEARRWQQGPWPVACRQPLRLAGLSPHPVDATAGARPLVTGHEWVAVHNPAPFPVALDGWTLRTGRGRRGHLPPLTVGPGATQLLPLSPASSLRLANGGGTLHVIDPCGNTRDSFAWGEAAEGMAFVRAGWRPGAGGGDDVVPVLASSIAPRSLVAIERMLKGPRGPWPPSPPPGRPEGPP